MPYSADLRSSYCSSELNIAWFYQALSDMGEDITFDSNTIEDEFQDFLDTAFNKWIVWKVFHHKQDDMIDRFESVWEYLRDKAIDFANEHTEVQFKFHEESDNETDKIWKECLYILEEGWYATDDETPDDVKAHFQEQKEELDEPVNLEKVDWNKIHEMLKAHSNYSRV